jgi:hypothetical protein
MACSKHLALCLAALLAAVVPLSTAHAQWRPNGAPFSSSCSPNNLRLAPDGAGGAFIASRGFITADDVMLQHLTSDGYVAPGWPINGLLLAASSDGEQLSAVTQDGFGGVLVTWQHFASSLDSIDVVVQRVRADGTVAPGWPASGLRIRAPDRQNEPQIAPDGSGGAFVVWGDQRNYATGDEDVYALHLLGDGTLAPGWPSTGAMMNAPQVPTSGAVIITDDTGGAFIEWAQVGAVTYGVHIRSDGSLASGWAPGGSLLSTLVPRGLVRDGSGGMYLWTAVPNSTYLGSEATYYVQRLTGSGAVTPGWPAGGLLVCSAPGPRNATSAETDGSGGMLMTWYDGRPPYTATEIFATRVLGNGTRAPGWALNGTLVSDPSNSVFEFAPYIAPDESGGAYIVWYQDGTSAVQHLAASGQVAAGWPPYGIGLSSSPGQLYPRITSDEQGGAIVAWEEGPVGYAQRYVTDGVTAAQLSLVSALANADRVHLDWFYSGATGLAATSYRRTELTDWISIAQITADGTGHLRYDDTHVTPGTRYAYRLGYRDGGAEQFTAETWVEVPAPKLALEGALPNPAVRLVNVSLSLADGSPATLSVLDVAGRAVMSREVGSLGAGHHTVPLDLGPAAAPGVYWLRLTQGGRALLARAAVIR